MVQQHQLLYQTVQILQQHCLYEVDCPVIVPHNEYLEIQIYGEQMSIQVVQVCVLQLCTPE